MLGTCNGGLDAPVCRPREKEDGLSRVRRVVAVGVSSALMLSVAAFPALAQGNGATQEEFVCFRSTGEKVRLGTGKVITTPSGNVNVVCTGEPID